MPCVSFHSTQLGCGFAHFVICFASTDASLLQEHPVEMIRGPVSDEIIRSSTRKKTRLVVRCICNPVGGPRDCAPVIATITKGEWTDGYVVCHSIPHLVSVFDVHVGATDVVQHVALYL